MREYNEQNLPTDYEGLMQLVEEGKIHFNQTTLGEVINDVINRPEVTVQLVINDATDRVFFRCSRGGAAYTHWRVMPEADVAGLEDFGQVLQSSVYDERHLEITSANGVNVTITAATLDSSATETATTPN